jgi:hypothetical protein
VTPEGPRTEGVTPRMEQENQPTTVAILGANTVVEKVLAQLLEVEGYSTRLLKASSTGVADKQQLAGVDLVLLSPSLTSGDCEALLDALRSTLQRTTTNSPIPVIALCSPMREAPLVEEAVRSVLWPVPFEHLVEEIEAMLAGRLPPGYRLDRSDPDVIILLSASGSVVSRFSGRGATQQTIEREAWEDYRERSLPA